MAAVTIQTGALGIKKKVLVTNIRGLHARAAAKVVKLSEQFQCDITVTHGDQSASGKSMLDLLMLAATPGSEIEIEAHGTDAAQAVDALAALVTRKFDEE